MIEQAVAVTKDDDIALFDIRAAIHEKLGDSKSALKDGQHMLRLDKTAGQVQDPFKPNESPEFADKAKGLSSHWQNTAEHGSKGDCTQDLRARREICPK